MRYSSRYPNVQGKKYSDLILPLVEYYRIDEAFNESLVWREPMAFSEDTIALIDRIIHESRYSREILDALIIVSTIPQHSLNALFLDRELSKDTMPERDAWWSIKLHDMWQNEGPIFRLVNWTWSLETSKNLDDENIDLYAITLAWTFTTSNRFLRDRATKALVNLLTDRLEATVRLVDRFADVDDPYVTERVYAVAYGVAMRSHDVHGISKLAKCVYEHVFESECPPVHILLRDYARGVIERAIHLGADIQVDIDRIRPPYKSTWPQIPSEKEISLLTPGLVSYDGRNPEWARERISVSVFHDDFGRYVLDSALSYWLSRSLHEPIGQSPTERQDLLVAEFSEGEKFKWDEYKIKEQEYNRMYWLKFADSVLGGDESEAAEGNITEDVENNCELVSTEKQRDDALRAFEQALSADHLESYRAIQADMENEVPQFDADLAKRYIVWRVFDLGWTTERFGEFDRFYLRPVGRSASKAERIGKKYQWIAYHEILAYLSDHFQYHERYTSDSIVHGYIGPWQFGLRDIDPSCVLRCTDNGSDIETTKSPWWIGHYCIDWNTCANAKEWLSQEDDIPPLESWLEISDPETDSRWLNLKGHVMWKKPLLPHEDSYESERFFYYIIWTGYLLKASDLGEYRHWAEENDPSTVTMPQASGLNQLFLGEYDWTQHSQNVYNLYKQEVTYENDSPVSLINAASELTNETSSFDCSRDYEESIRFKLPNLDIIQSLGLSWHGETAQFVDKQGECITYDPSVLESGPSVLLIRKDSFQQFLQANNLAICWAVTGQKYAASRAPIGYRALSGAFWLNDNEIEGAMEYIAYRLQ